MDGVVLAAGRGSRLGSLTETNPKALVDVGDVPLLSHCLDDLVSAGMTRLIVVIGYLGDQLRDFYGEEFAGVPIEYRVQEKQLGLAHALLHAEDAVTDDFMLLNGDHIFTTDLGRMAERHNAENVDGALLVYEVSPDVATKATICKTTNDGTITEIVHQPADPPERSFAIAGCQTYTSAAFDASQLVQPSDRGEYELTDTLKILLASGRRLVAVKSESQPINVNTMSDLEKARQYVYSE